MKKRNKYFIIVFSLILYFPQILMAQNAVDILHSVEHKLNSFKFLQYKATHLSIDPSVEDSLFESRGEVWLEKLPSDSIFCARFHVRGNDKNGDFNYFYDGQNSIELREYDTSMTLFDPYKYPNDPKNPAKARTALFPFVKYFVDNQFILTLLKDNPKVALDSNQNSFIITLKYPENSFGQNTTTKLLINKKDYLISGIDYAIIWRGITFQRKITISGYSINDAVDRNNIVFSGNYTGYKRQYVNGNNEQKEFISELIGKEAKEFSFESYNGQKISLKNLKGKIVLLDFWESWCGYCIASLPDINNLKSIYKDDEVYIIGITIENRNIIKKLIRNNGLTYINVFADKSILRDYKVSSRPTYVLINKMGIIEFVSYGNLKEVKEKIKQMVHTEIMGQNEN